MKNYKSPLLARVVFAHHKGLIWDINTQLMKSYQEKDSAEQREEGRRFSISGNQQYQDNWKYISDNLELPQRKPKLTKENSSFYVNLPNMLHARMLEALDFDCGFNVIVDDGDEEINKEEAESISEDDRKIRKIFKYIFDGKCLENPQNRYYMLSLSGVNGRVMIRSYDEGYYKDLYESIHSWYEDLKLILPFGKGMMKFPKLWTVYSRLLKFSKDNKDISKRISNELSGLSSQIIYAATHNTMLPNAVAAKALAYIRSKMYSSSDEGKSNNKNIDGVSCQILKTWLNRKYRNQNKEEFIIMDKLNENSPSKAYNVGRLMAVYAALQNSALGDVGAGVVERYYTSACTSPALVIGRLSTLSQYHLSKVDKGARIYYSKLLQEISACIGTTIPKTFSLEEQSEFALGFYTQTANIYSKSNNNETETEE